MRRFLLLLPILLLFATLQPAAARKIETTFSPGAHLRFEHLTIDNGLSQNAGLALLQDRQGYLWIGTQDGLNRYDGYTITQFKHDPANPKSISANSIIALYQDRAGFLWIGTWGGGLNRFDPLSGQFTRYLPDPQNPASLSHPIVTDIFQDDHGAFWVATLGGLDLLDPATGAFTHFRSDPANANTLSSNAVSVIVPAADGKLWLGTGAFGTPGAGLNLFDPATGKNQRFAASGECLASPNIADILPAPDGSLWIAFGGYAVSGGGLDHYQPQTGACTHFDNARTFDNQITDNNLTDLAYDRDGALWVTSWSSGVWRMSPEGQFYGIHHNPADPDSLSNDNTFSVIQDRSGVIWIGTLSAGINKLTLDTLQFRTYRTDPSNPNSLPSNHIGSFAETTDGKIWVGTWEAGLARFDPASGVFTSFKNDPKNPNSLSSDLVMSLYADTDGTLWVGTLGGGLNHLDPRTNQFTRYQNDSANPASLLENQVTYISRDPAGRLWVCNFAGLSRLDPGAQGFVNYPLPAPATTFRVIGSDLWVGTWGGGVFRLDLSNPASLDPAKAAFTNMAHDGANPNSLSQDGVWSILHASNGLVWLATEGGLNRYDPHTGIFKAYTEKDGLRNATVLGLLQDKNGFLWLTTNNGLAKFDPQTETFQIYGKSDGLQGNEFNSNAFFNARNGDFYVGGVNGFSIFDPLSLRQNTLPPPVVITKFSIFNIPQSFNLAETIRLNYDQNFISFEFAALDYHDPRSNQYAYKLEGFDQDWVQSGMRNYASYTNLPGGEYTFRVRAANSDGVWNETGTSLKLKVTPPFWLTLPFQLGVILGVLSLAAAGYQWRIRAVRQQNTRLQKVIDEQKRVEVELRQSEARFRAMYENAAIGISLIAPDGRVLAVNPVLSRLSGRSESELMQLGGQEITYPEDKDVGRQEFSEVLSGVRDSYQVEKRYIHKDGRVHWMRQSVSAVRDENGRALYMIVIAEDIDERKRAVEELRDSEARFKAMYDNVAVGMAMMSLDRKIIHINQTSARMTGYSLEELVGTDPTRLSHPDDLQIGREQFSDLTAGKIPGFQLEKRFIRKNGEIFWGRVTYSIVPDQNGQPEYLVGIIEDVTEEKEAARTLAESEARFRTLYNSAEMGIVLIDLGSNGNLPLDDERFNQLVANQRLNPAMQRMFGYTAEELQHIPIASLIHPEDVGIDRREFRQLLAGEIDSFRIEKRFVRKDGSVFWGRLTDSLARSPDGVPHMVIGIIEDITEEKLAAEKLAAQEAEDRRQLEQRIAERTEELIAANERLREKTAHDAVTAERTRLARDLHDAVTQTLFSTTLIADVLPDIWERNPDEGKRRLEEIRQLTRGALAEMRTLLVELRPNALVEVPLPTLLRQLTEALIGRSRMNIQLSAEGERKLPADVQVGLYRLAQEALNNVVKHAKASQAVVTLRCSDDSVRLTIADNGVGFDPSTVTADHLGLKIMRERAEAIGAKLSIYSEPGEGTQVSITWRP
ncbi:MAG TPA: PAS domain S-box protein [Anaerolineaceae bacterium]